MAAPASGYNLKSKNKNKRRLLDVTRVGTDSPASPSFAVTNSALLHLFQ